MDRARATDEERLAPLPGDDLVVADVVMDRGFDLPAPPDEVWPWLVQLGKRRAGWYLPGSVERLVPPSRRPDEETLSAVEQVGFMDAFTFKFSPRDGTPATRFPDSDTVPDDVASARLERLIETVRRGARERNLSLLGTRQELLIEKAARRGGGAGGLARRHRQVSF